MNFFTFAKLWRTVLPAALLMVGAVWLSGCDGGDEEGGGGDSYDYVELGGKKWMSKNLNKATASTSDSRCYGDNSSNCNTYGRLYKWEAAKSACQSIGWRLPTEEEWEALVAAAGGSSVANEALKSTSGWDGNGNGTDAYGFSALPGGGYTSSYGGVGTRGNWWTASSAGYAVYYSLFSDYDPNLGFRYLGENYRYYSVRCVR